jgi:hypothetical protein
MKLIQDNPGHNWHTDDTAKLFIARTGELNEAPKTISCFVTNDSLNSGEVIEVEFTQLEFIAPAVFGDSRPSLGGRSTRWTGSAYKYALYQHGSTYEIYPAIVIIETHGGGTQGYYIKTLTAVDTWRHFAHVLPTETLWNICHDLSRMYANARYIERKIIHTQFLQGRLKRVRRNKRLFVEVLPERMDEVSIAGGPSR